MKLLADSLKILLESFQRLSPATAISFGGLILIALSGLTDVVGIATMNAGMSDKLFFAGCGVLLYGMIQTTLRSILSEVRPNGGASMKDLIVSLSNQFERHDARIATVQKSVEQNSQRLGQALDRIGLIEVRLDKNIMLTDDSQTRLKSLERTIGNAPFFDS